VKRPSKKKCWNSLSKKIPKGKGDIDVFNSELVEEEHKKLPEGQKISYERMNEILYHVFNKAKAQSRKPSQDARFYY